MTLSEYLEMLFPFFGDRKGFGITPKTKKGRGKADFVTFILGAIVEEGWETECPILDLQAGTLRKIMSGASPFSAINAIPFNNHIDKERFAEVLSEDAQSFDSLVALSKALSEHGLINDGTLDDILAKCADALEQIIAEAARPKGKRDFSDACDAVEKAIQRIPVLKGRKLLFSPYQTIRVEEVDSALGLSRKLTTAKSSGSYVDVTKRTASLSRNIELREGSRAASELNDSSLQHFCDTIKRHHKQGRSKEKIVQSVFDEMVTATQTRFYPFIAMLFRVLGFDASTSRSGDNGARWDAIIVDKTDSIPIEIKSPTEEQHISLKAIRQALENKVILLSRETHPTRAKTTSLAVGYYLPNDRAEVTNLILDFKTTYGFSIGVIDLATLLKMAVSIILDGSTFNRDDLIELEGGIC